MLCKKRIKKIDTIKTMVVTSISFVDNKTNQGKLEKIKQIAKLCGEVRTDIWNKYSVKKGWNCDVFATTKDHIANVKHYKDYNLSYKLFGRTMYQLLKDISLYHEAIKSHVIKAIYKEFQDKGIRKELCNIVKSGSWKDIESNPWLHRQVRKYLYKGHSQVNNQIMLSKEQYRIKTDDKNNQWVGVSSNVSNKIIWLPLKGKVDITSEVRLVIKENKVELHYPKKIEIERNLKQKAERVGIDRGYTEVFATSDGEFLGEGLGKIISSYTEQTTEKCKKRNKLGAIVRKLKATNNQKSINKANRIVRNNLGKIKLNRSTLKAQRQIKNVILPAVNQLVNNYSEIALEDLSIPIVSNKPMRKKTKHNLSQWCKGEVIKALEHKAKLGCSQLYLQAAAYTSQFDVHTQTLAVRRGDWIYSITGGKYQADVLASQAILERSYDKEITQYMNHVTIKSILWQRTQEYIKRCGMDCTMTLDMFKEEIRSRHHLNINQ